MLLSADYEDGTRWTTKESILLEKNILKLIQEGKNQVEPLVEKEFVTKALDNTQLTNSQKEAVFLITTTHDRFIAIQGLPGTGKSTMLSNVISIVNEAKKMTDNKIEFVGLAPTWQVVNELKEKGVVAQTFASFLQEMKSDAFDKEKYKNTVFLFDESSMASNKDKSDFLICLSKSNSRAIDIGDMEQLQGQGSGKPFELAIKRGMVECVYLTDIIRQNPSPELKMAVEDIIDKDVKASFDRIENQHGFESFGTKNNTTQDEFLTALNAKNIVETYKKVTGISKLDGEISKNEILIQGASEYLERTSASRENSIFIAYSNRERDEFSYLVREGLKEEGVLNKKSEVFIERLRPLNLTRAEMQTMDAYSQKYDSNGDTYERKLILSFGKDKYFEVSDVDKLSKLVTLIDVKTSEIKIFNPLRHDHKNTQLWNQSTQKLAEGDLVVLRRADKDRGHISNVEYIVDSTDKKSKVVVLKNSDGILTLDTKELKDCHWDYSYAKTSDMAQGSTRKFMVSMVHSQSSLTNIRRAIVDMSRASTHAMLITDKKNELIKRLEGKTLQSVATNHGDKRSALDTIEKKFHAPGRYFNVKKEINDAGKINISLDDEIKNKRDLKQQQIDSNRIASAQSIYQETSKIQNTIGEQYLHKTRGISLDTIARSEIRFWEKESIWKNTNEKGDLVDQKNKTNAIIVPAVDKNGDITGVQRIYLDNQLPEKNKLMSNSKLSKGIVAGSPGVIQQGDNGKLFVAEGPETALSIAEVEPNATVLCAFSVNNFKNMSDVIKSHAPSEVIIIGDNDGALSQAYQQTENAKLKLMELTNLPVVTVYPDSLPGKEKTDFNDILIHGGKEKVSDMIQKGLKIEKEINASLVEKYRYAIDTGLSLDHVNNLARTVGQAQNLLKLNKDKYSDLVSIINKSNDVNKTINSIKILENSYSTSKQQVTTQRMKSIENIELEI